MEPTKESNPLPRHLTTEASPDAEGTDLPEWFGVEGLAEWIDVPVATIYKWRASGRGPRCHKLGRLLRYRRSDVESWLSAHAEAS